LPGSVGGLWKADLFTGNRDSDKWIGTTLKVNVSHMQVFFQAWEVVVQFIKADANVPRDHFLPRPPARQVARYLADRRQFNILEVVEALEPLAQPHLLRTAEQSATIVETRKASVETTSALIAPIPQESGQG
jgi:hypothetical protein